jgi:phasin family protein
MVDAGAKKTEFVAPNGALFASQRKNVEAMMQANWAAIVGAQAIWLRQLDFIQEAVNGLTTLVGDITRRPGPLNEKLAKHVEYSKQAFERNLGNARELTELATEATNESINTVSQRFYEGLGEMRLSLESGTVRPQPQ